MSKYFEKLIKTKKTVLLRADMGYLVTGYIVDVSSLGIVFHILKSHHADYEEGKDTFISASMDCSFTVI